MAFEPEILEIENSGSEITVLGSRHSEQFTQYEENMDKLEDLMGESDHFVWEFAASGGLERGDTFAEMENNFPIYTREVSDLAGQYYDEILGADYMNNTLPWAYTAGFFSATSPFWYPVYKLVGKPFLKDKLGFGGDESGEAGVDYDRREFMRKAGKEGAKFGALLYPGAATIGTTAISSSQDGPDEKQAKLEFGTVGDFREVYASETIANLSEELGGDILAVYGLAHSGKIAEYLENEELRNRKLAAYSILGSDEELEPELWEYRDQIDDFIYQGTIEF